MESEEGEESSIPFQLQFDKPIPFQVCSKLVAFSDFRHGGLASFSYGGNLGRLVHVLVD